MKLPKLTLRKLANIIEKNFGPPFLEKEHVRCCVTPGGKTLMLAIGRRDIEIDENGTIIGSGTCV